MADSIETVTTGELDHFSKTIIEVYKQSNIC